MGRDDRRGRPARLFVSAAMSAFFSGLSTGRLHGWAWAVAAFIGSYYARPRRALRSAPRTLARRAESAAQSLTRSAPINRGRFPNHPTRPKTTAASSTNSTETTPMIGV